MRKLSLLLAVVTIITGCSSSSPEKSTDRTELRLIAAAAGAAEILNEIGLGDLVVGVDERNAEAISAQIVTSGHSFNFEKLVATRPTHVILDALTDSKEVRDRLELSNLEIVELPTAENIAQIFNKYEILGAVFNRSIEAESAGLALREKFNEFSATKTGFRIVFLYLRGTNSIYLVGGKGSGADSLITAVGSFDVGAEKLDKPFSPLSSEVMSQLNPEVLLLMKNGFESVGGLAGLRALPGLAGSIAVQQGNIVLIDDRELLNFGPGTINVLRQIQKQLRMFSVA